MASDNIGGLLEKRRAALVEYCIGHATKEGEKKYPFVRDPDDLFELLRMDPLDSYAVQNSWLAGAVTSAQQYIHAVYRKLEPGFTKTPFDKWDLDLWALYNNYPDWAALQYIAYYPENYMTPFVRRRKTSLFKNLENSLNQSSLNTDTVQAALQEYLQTFEKTCNLDVVSCYMDGISPLKAVYYFVARTRSEPCQYYWRKAEIELYNTDTAVNPAAWGEWRLAEVTTGPNVLDIRPVFWNGRLYLVWAEWREKIVENDVTKVPALLTINLSYKTLNDQWSPPLMLAEYKSGLGLPTDSRLVVFPVTNSQHPKGKLGIMWITSPESFVADPIVLDALLRPLPMQGERWLNLAISELFKSRETVQHPLLYQPSTEVTAGWPGSMVPYLSLQAMVMGIGDEDVLLVQGFCTKTKWPDHGPTVRLVLKLEKSDDGDELYDRLYPIEGEWYTDVLVLKRAKGGWTVPTVVSFGGHPQPGYGGIKLSLTIANVPSFTPPALLKNTLNAAQFLSFNQSQLALKHCRLNSLFGPELVQHSNISVEALLDWKVQHISEPPPDSATITESNGAFDGANGLFFWELFFHLPHLVATRLRTEDRFAEAQNWLHYVFDPQAPADEKPTPPAPQPPNPKPLYWRCRPLVIKGNPGFEAQNPTDPDAIGYAKPRHFQILMFTEYVQNLIAWGDWYYRQLTRDSLAAAKLCYVQASFMMGKASEVRTVNKWQPETVGNLLSKSGTRPSLEAFELNLDFSLEDVPSASDTPPQMGLLANEPFKVPINSKLLDLFALPEQRMYNMRNNLTIDGKPLDIPFFSPRTDPNQLLRDLASGGVAGPRPMGGRLVVGAFRWRVMFEAALRAVQSLQEYGNQVLNLLERRDRAEQEEMEKNHMVELGTYAQTMQQLAIDQMIANVTALEVSQIVAQQRADTYAQLYERNVSGVEYDVMESLQASKILSLTSASIKPVGALLKALPNIFGLANGGHRLESIADAVCFGLDVAASVMQIDADRQATTEAYRRRREEWELQRNQALAEVSAIDAQIAAQQYAVTAAQTSLEQTLRANSQALTVYNFLKKRATNAQLYGWMLGQLKALHNQAHDAVVSMCLAAQASLSAEVGDFDSPIPLPQVWLDNHYGLTAGEHLREYLLRMEREYLQRHERRQELVKTVSLRQLFNDEHFAQTGIANWEAALKQLQEKGTLEFKLTQLLFDRDHPGHYCRQTSMVEVDLPALKGPFEDVRATLLQISSMIATKPTTQSVTYGHNPDGVMAPAEMLVNLRSGQQMTLSTGVADNGMNAMKPDDAMLYTFENTGAISRWMLNFPRHKSPQQAAMLLSLTDIIVRIRYTAKVGEPTFIRQVEDMVTKAEKDASGKSIKGANDHA